MDRRYFPAFLSVLFLIGAVIRSESVLAKDMPFPFSDKSVEEEMDASDFVAEVPIPPDTIGFATTQDAEGYVPEIYGRSAPIPSALRPRYLSDGSQAEKGEKKTVSSPKKNGKIRQVSTEEPFPTLSPPPPVTKQETTAPSESLPDHRLSSAAIAPPQTLSPSRKTAPAWEVNNTHTCDELTCGGGCGGGYAPGWSARHLGEQRPRRGLCECCGLLTCSNKIHGPWFFDGWLSVGSFMNTHWPDNRSNDPLYYNDRNGEAVLNQFYLSFGRRANTNRNRFDWGGRVDLLYGSDYYYTSSLGLETRTYDRSERRTLDPLEARSHWNSNDGVRRYGTAALYGLSMPQAYAEAFIPWGNGVTIRAGHFYADMGIESAMSPQNFFYSHSYSFMYGAPVTLTGATATIKVGPRLSAILGVTQGWNTFDNPADNTCGLAGLQWQNRNTGTDLSFMVHSGKESLRGGDVRTSYSLAFRQRLGARWHYALEHTFGYEDNGSLVKTYIDQRAPARWVSLAQYLQWELNEKLSLGMRVEWFRDDGHSRIQQGATDDLFYKLRGKDYYELTLGLNWKPTRYITVRPEVRYDWSKVKIVSPFGSEGVYSNGDKGEMLSFAIDAVFRF